MLWQYDIDENVQFWLKHRIVVPCINCLKKLIPLCKAFCKGNSLRIDQDIDITVQFCLKHNNIALVQSSQILYESFEAIH